MKETTEETCYYCGNPIWLKENQFIVQCGLCNETLCFAPSTEEEEEESSETFDKVVCPSCTSYICLYPTVGPIRCTECQELIHSDASVIPDKQHMCRVCGKRFRSENREQKHTKKHMAKRLECKHCCNTFSNYLERKSHELSRHSVKFVCSVCRRTFLSKKDLAVHHKIHYKYSCETCGNKFIKERYLKIHCLSHIQKCEKGEQVERIDFRRKPSPECATKPPFTCSYCGMTIQTKAYFIDHTEAHKQSLSEIGQILKSNQIKCSACGVIFASQKDMLENHLCHFLQKSTAVKQYKCGDCGFSFLQLKQLEEHECKSKKNLQKEQLIEEDNSESTINGEAG